MPTLFNSDEFRDRKEWMLEVFNQHKIAHIQVKVLHDDAGKDSPISELAGLFEFLVNTLIGDIVLGGNDSAASLLEHVVRGLEAQILLMASLMDDRIEGRKEALGKREEKEEQLEIPEAFKDVLEQIQRKREA